MRPRGFGAARAFTLVELVVSMGVAAITIAMVVMIVVTQQRSMRATEEQRASSEAGRDALFELEKTLRRAGFGLDPRYAFDFRSFRCSSGEVVTGVGNRSICRDRIDAPDRLVFVARNPYYRIDVNGVNGCTSTAGCPTGNAWVVTGRSTSPSTPTVTVVLHANQRVEAGQTLLISCASGGRFTMSTVVAAAEVTTPTAVTLRLAPTNSANPYFENGFVDSCYDSNALAFAIDRYAYSIRTYDGVPWLVLDTGLDLDRDGQDPWSVIDEDDLLPIAPYVEDMQVAYVLDRNSGGAAADSNGDRVVGNDAGLKQAEEPDATATAPVYATTFDDSSRRNLHPANIRAVRVGLVLRSEKSDSSATGAASGQTTKWIGDPLPLLENSSRTLTDPALGYFRRQTAMTTVSVRNLASRGMFTF
jgi:type IV pilus assembly protein PilW